MDLPEKPTPALIALARAVVSEMARKAGATKSPARAAASRRNLQAARDAKARKLAARRTA
jgi:hypothetical protein